MSLITISATISEGKILPDEPEKIPLSGRALVTVLPDSKPSNGGKRTVADLVSDLAGTGAGKFKDLSTNKAHLDDLGR